MAKRHRRIPHRSRLAASRWCSRWWGWGDRKSWRGFDPASATRCPHGHLRNAPMGTPPDWCDHGCDRDPPF